ncbi:MAG: LacI family DNA-binding transcriptional regulator [Phycisphaeraceae bacterium]|nr:LacI family DNA-binding transcriptional regulator [Phycisphaeraceae bacterium]
MTPSAPTPSSTIRQVSRMAGVSPTTVSRVLNNSPIPTEATRRRVLEAVQKMGYQPDPQLSASLKRRKGGDVSKPAATGTVGYLGSRLAQAGLQINDGYYSAALTGIHDVLQARQYHLLWTLHDVNSLEVPAPVVDHRVDGLVIQTGMADELRRLLIQRLPVVLLDRTPGDEQADCVLMNYERAMRTQLNYLWQLGHRRVAYFRDAVPTYANVVGFRVFQAFFAEHGLPADPDGLCRARDISPATNDQVLAEYARDILAAPSRPTALVSMNFYAAGIMANLMALGLRVPEQFSIAGLNDQNSGQMTHPALTSYFVPMRVMGAAAAELLLERFDQPGRPCRQVMLDGHSIERASCGQAPVTA